MELLHTKTDEQLMKMSEEDSFFNRFLQHEGIKTRIHLNDEETANIQKSSENIDALSKSL